jgi:type IV pilus assembly protein PilQ
MRTHLKPLAGIVLWGALAAAPARAEPNVIRAIDVAEREGAVELSIQGNRAPSYTVFKLQDPPRLVVDLAGADVSKVPSPVEVGKAGVIAVSTAQYKDERTAVGRVIVSLEGARRYEVAPRGDAVVVKVLGDAAEATPTATPAASPTPTAAAARTEENVVVAQEARIEASPAPAARADDHVVVRRVDEGSGAATARALTGVSAGPGRVLLQADGEVGRFEVIELRDPPRLAIDLHGLTRAPARPARGGAGFAAATTATPRFTRFTS